MSYPENCFFVSDLHGNRKKYQLLFELIRQKKPEALFLGGDLFSRTAAQEAEIFFYEFLQKEFCLLKADSGGQTPEIFLILGNDDPRILEEYVLELEKRGVWRYVNLKKISWKNYFISGYSFIPPSPFLLKDWERYDVSRFVDVGAVPVEEGIFSVEPDRQQIPFLTIEQDLQALYRNENLENFILLFHAPPYNSGLDLAQLKGKMVDHAPLDPHIGSIAIQRFIEESQPLLTLHGHVHESFSLSGIFKERIKKSWSISAAAPAQELALILFNPEEPAAARRLSFQV